MATGIGDLKTGFWLGLGIALAIAALGIAQMLLSRAVKRDGS